MEEGGQHEEEDVTPMDPNHEMHSAARERAMNCLMNLVDCTLEFNDRLLTCCVVRGDPRHALRECQFDENMVRSVQRGVEIMQNAIYSSPKHQRQHDSAMFSDTAQQQRESSGSMDVEAAESVASSGRRPKAKARPRRSGETITSDLILMRYDTAQL